MSLPSLRLWLDSHSATPKPRSYLGSANDGSPCAPKAFQFHSYCSFSIYRIHRICNTEGVTGRSNGQKFAIHSAIIYEPMSAEDILKLLLFVLVGAGLLGLGRWSSRLGQQSESDSPPDAATPDIDEIPGNEQVIPRVWPPGADETAASFPLDASLGKFRITKFFFEKVDAIPGPIDRDVFADELHLQLYDPDSGNYWWQSYFVATPQGLAQILRDKSWKYVYAPEMLVLPRYDLEEIRRAVVSRVIADNEFFKDKKDKETSQEELL